LELNAQTLIKQLLEAGVHFGHQRNKWNPKMKEYIFTEKSGVYIIDLQKTVDALLKACNFLRDLAAGGGNILFVCTKKQGQDVVKDAAVKTGMFYVVNRWLGGLLTNFETVRKSVARYDKIESMKADGTFDKLSKKEGSQLNKELVKLRKNLEGVRYMKSLPDVMFIIDPHREIIAVREAAKMKIPVVSLIDTNCDPDLISYVIPGNDDAIRSIRLITTVVLDFVLKGKEKFIAGRKEEEAEKEKAKVTVTPDHKLKGADDKLVEEADEIAKRFKHGKKDEKIEEEKTIKPKTQPRRKT